MSKIVKNFGVALSFILLSGSTSAFAKTLMSCSISNGPIQRFQIDLENGQKILTQFLSRNSPTGTSTPARVLTAQEDSQKIIKLYMEPSPFPGAYSYAKLESGSKVAWGTGAIWTYYGYDGIATYTLRATCTLDAGQKP